MLISENKSLKQYNTFGIDVNARFYSEFNNIPELQELLSDKYVKNLPQLILGGGSNVLFTQDFNGIVLKNKLRGLEVTKETETHVYVKSGAGEVWHELVLFAIKNNWAGLENLSLIPGNVGASPMQNIGAYGVEIKDTFHELEALHITTGAITHFNARDCEFGYRESVFKRAAKGQYVILSVTFKLSKTPTFHTSYGVIEQELERMNIKELSIQAVSQAVINIRSSKLPNPKEIGNAGSFFKNPEIDAAQANALKIAHPTIPQYPTGNEKIKLAAGWLIEQCGWKGYTRGDAGVHKLQALVLVNYKNATGSEIYQLSEEIIQSVKEKFNVTLEREVNIY